MEIGDLESHIGHETAAQTGSTWMRKRIKSGRGLHQALVGNASWLPATNGSLRIGSRAHRAAPAGAAATPALGEGGRSCGRHERRRATSEI